MTRDALGVALQNHTPIERPAQGLSFDAGVHSVGVQVLSVDPLALKKPTGVSLKSLALESMSHSCEWTLERGLRVQSDQSGDRFGCHSFVRPANQPAEEEEEEEEMSLSAKARGCWLSDSLWVGPPVSRAP